MSVLLEALKKAAAEKQQKQKAASENKPSGFSLMDEHASLSDEHTNDSLQLTSQQNSFAAIKKSSLSLEPLVTPADTRISSSDKQQEDLPESQFEKPIEKSKPEAVTKIQQLDMHTSVKTYQPISESTEQRVNSLNYAANSKGVENKISVKSNEKPQHNKVDTNELDDESKLKAKSDLQEETKLVELKPNDLPTKNWLNPPIEPLPANKPRLFSKFSTKKANQETSRKKARGLAQFFSSNSNEGAGKKITNKKSQVSEKTFVPLIYLLFALTFFVALFYYAFHYYSQLQSEYNADVQRLMNIVNSNSEQSRTPVNLAVELDKRTIYPDTASQEPSAPAAVIAPSLLEDTKRPTPKPEPTARVITEQSSDQTSRVSDQVRVKPLVQTQDVASTRARITVDKATAESSALLAFEAYQMGGYAKAYLLYNRHLTSHPNSRVSQLGLAAIAAHRGQYETALNFYQRILADDPHDKDAKLGIASLASMLAGLKPNDIDLADILKRNPYSADLQFAVGNVYAKQRDWFKAQQYYFESVKLEPSNSNFRINLAISLDHLGDFNSALNHYKHALALVDLSDRRFNLDAIQKRVLALETFLGVE